MSNQVNKNNIEDRYQFEQWKDANFTGKHITKRKFNNASFLNCDFTGAIISICEFDKDSEFVNCKFLGTTFLNCVFSNTKIMECEFSKTKFEDVAIKDTCNLIRNEISNDCIVNNFTVRGAKIQDISQLISVNSVSDQESAERINTESVEQYEELDSRQSLDDDLKIYKVIFPELMKQYPYFEKDEDSDSQYPGYHMVVDNIEFAFAEDEGGWRVMFFIHGGKLFDGDCIGSQLVWVPTNKEITFETCKEEFEKTVKITAESIISRSVPVIKRSIEKFLQIVFKTAVEANEQINGSVVVETSINPEAVNSFLTTGYDTETKKAVIIVGKPFVTENIAEANAVRAKITKAGFMINEDIAHLTNEELHKYAQENPYSCFVYEHSDMMDRVNIKPFGKSKNIIMK